MIKQPGEFTKGEMQTVSTHMKMFDCLIYEKSIWEQSHNCAYQTSKDVLKMQILANEGSEVDIHIHRCPSAFSGNWFHHPCHTKIHRCSRPWHKTVRYSLLSRFVDSVSMDTEGQLYYTAYKTLWATSRKYIKAPLVAQLVKNPPAMQKTPVWFLGQEDPLEKG